MNFLSKVDVRFLGGEGSGGEFMRLSIVPKDSFLMIFKS